MAFVNELGNISIKAAFTAVAATAATISAAMLSIPEVIPLGEAVAVGTGILGVGTGAIHVLGDRLGLDGRLGSVSMKAAFAAVAATSITVSAGMLGVPEMGPIGAATAVGTTTLGVGTAGLAKLRHWLHL